MFASSFTVSGSSVTEISSIRMERAVSGVRSWCEASAASRLFGGQHPGDPLGRGVQDIGDPVQLGHPVPLVARAGIPGAEAFGGLGEVGERGGQPVRLAYGEQHGRDDRQQRHRADDQEGAPDLAGDGRAGLLDGDGLALLPGLDGAQDAADGAFADGDGLAAGDLDQCVPLGVDLLGQHPGIDPLRTQLVRLSTTLISRSASDSTLSWALALMVRVSTITSETPKTAMTTSTTASVELISRMAHTGLRGRGGRSQGA